MVSKALGPSASRLTQRSVERRHIVWHGGAHTIEHLVHDMSSTHSVLIPSHA